MAGSAGGERSLAATVEVSDEEGNVLPAGQEGIIRISTTSMVTSYIGEPEAAAKAFRDGWFYPGDIGYQLETGDFYVTGRGRRCAEIRPASRPMPPPLMRSCNRHRAWWMESVLWKPTTTEKTRCRR